MTSLRQQHRKIEVAYAAKLPVSWLSKTKVTKLFAPFFDLTGGLVLIGRKNNTASSSFAKSKTTDITANLGN